MLENYFKDPKTINKFRSGYAGAYLDDFAGWLKNDGYQYPTIRRHIRGANQLSTWALNDGYSINCFNNSFLDTFSTHLETDNKLKYSSGRHTSTFIGARLFITYLRVNKIVLSPEPILPKKLVPPLLQDFCQWMRTQRGVMESTLANYSPIISNLINTLGENPEEFEAKMLRKFVLNNSNTDGIGKIKNIVTSVRMFLRFLISIGRCSVELQHAIPTVAEWNLSSLPKYLNKDKIDQIIVACDTLTPLGIRDLAIILLMVQLGLRAGDVAGLKLDDLEWQEGTLVVAGKSRNEVRLPLPQDVGEAILHYLEKGRPNIKSSKLFITTIAPFKPISTKVVTQTARRAICRAGVDAPSYGAHLFRHSAATEMLRKGASLQTIGTILRHSSIETTAHYAKVDLNLLNQLSCPWPEVT